MNTAEQKTDGFRYGRLVYERYREAMGNIIYINPSTGEAKRGEWLPAWDDLNFGQQSAYAIAASSLWLALIKEGKLG